MDITALPVFNDNYVWLLTDSDRAMAVDPGDAQPVLEALKARSLTLECILVTHHHADHIGGVPLLRQATGAQVFGPALETLNAPYRPVADEECFLALGQTWRTLLVPGHTAGHIAFYCEPPSQAPLLLSGDTLFCAGCGRVFEGNPAQMLASLDRLAALPDATRVLCAHEYTLGNLRFAAAVEPGNTDITGHLATCERLRAEHQSTLPSTLGLERLINPFLRTRQRAVIAAATAHGAKSSNPVEIFATLREWKNNFS